MKNNVAIIPARGGSQRIEKKNIKDFLGKPILAHSINLAIESNLFQEVMVSTDDEEIAGIARDYGASVPFMRSRKNADNFATLADVILEVTHVFSEKGYRFKYGCCILPTAPLMTIKRLKEGYDMICQGKFNTVRPVVKYAYPIQRALKLKNGEVEMFHPEHLKTRSQDLEPAYYDAGQFYWFKFDMGMVPSKRGALVLPESEVQDIDDLEDWKMAEIKYRLLNEISKE